eukprot:6212618-Pleurochrysis_carterae.AAC.1
MNQPPRTPLAQAGIFSREPRRFGLARYHSSPSVRVSTAATGAHARAAPAPPPYAPPPKAPPRLSVGDTSSISRSAPRAAPRAVPRPVPCDIPRAHAAPPFPTPPP